MKVDIIYGSGVYSLYDDGRVEFPVCPLEDCVIAGSRECRFGGHTNKFYSINEHAINVADMVYERSGNAEWALQGLWHEAGETLGFRDINGPLKERHGKKLRKYEQYVIKAIFGRIGISYPYSPLVHQVDKEFAVIEGLTLCPTTAKLWVDVPSWRLTFKCHCPEKAASEFRAAHRRYNALRSG